jgi:hypothetical protein
MPMACVEPMKKRMPKNAGKTARSTAPSEYGNRSLRRNHGRAHKQYARVEGQVRAPDFVQVRIDAEGDEWEDAVLNKFWRWWKNHPIKEW